MIQYINCQKEGFGAEVEASGDFDQPVHQNGPHFEGYFGLLVKIMRFFLLVFVLFREVEEDLVFMGNDYLRVNMGGNGGRRYWRLKRRAGLKVVLAFGSNSLRNLAGVVLFF